MDSQEWKELFSRSTTASPDAPNALVVSETMMKIVKNDNSTTMAEVGRKLTEVINSLKRIPNGIILASVAELFFRYITLNTSLHSTIELCRADMINRGNIFIERIKNSRSKIAKLGHRYILDGCMVLTHSYSRVVLETFKQAAAYKKSFKVLVTVSEPDKSGQKTKELLDKEGIPCELILDSAIGYVIENVDMVLVGAESVVESGGIINKIGTYLIGICAKELNKPLYVLTESFKFARLFPLNQQDLPKLLKEQGSEDEEELYQTLKDYTPPRYITLLFTDLGILTPSAVSDELIKIYT
ncbi:hypothetical protein CHUAL_005743 [Chamberlinius hualienensis]